MKEKNITLISVVIVILLLLMAACNPILSSAQQDSPVSSSGTDPVNGQLAIEDGRIFDCQLLIPQEWTGRIEQRQAGNVVYFDYNADPKNPLFSISASTKERWQEVLLESGTGKELLSLDGVVFAYNIALDNPYSGSQAEEFQKMAGQVKSVVANLRVSVSPAHINIEKARQTLVTFFDLLSNGNYVEASELYGGSYEELIDMNPGIDPDDHASLLESACTVNGYQCLPVKDIVQEVPDWPDSITFTVTFVNPDGSLFELGACCGEAATDAPLQTSFDFPVMRVTQAEDAFLVQRLPVYTP